MSTTAQVAKAFLEGRQARCHNASTDGTTYRLHGHPIAVREPGVIKFDWCDWHTSTTARHMNAILRATDSHRVSYAKARDAGERTFAVLV